MNHTPDWRTALRCATSSLHSQLDSQPVLSVFKGQDISATRYRDALILLYQPHRYLESVVQQAIEIKVIDYPYQHRSDDLARDIQALGYETGKIAESGIPITTSTPVNDSPTLNQVCGYLYLLEGSKQGSQYIKKQLEKHAKVPLPSRFLTAEASMVQPNMNLFWQFLESISLDESNMSDITTAARNAFRFYIHAVQHGHLNTRLLDASLTD